MHLWLTRAGADRGGDTGLDAVGGRGGKVGRQRGFDQFRFRINHGAHQRGQAGQERGFGSLNRGKRAGVSAQGGGAKGCGAHGTGLGADGGIFNLGLHHAGGADGGGAGELLGGLTFGVILGGTFSIGDAAFLPSGAKRGGGT